MIDEQEILECCHALPAVEGDILSPKERRLAVRVVLELHAEGRRGGSLRRAVRSRLIASGMSVAAVLFVLRVLIPLVLWLVRRRRAEASNDLGE